MSNMGYCRFQNTLTDLQNCYSNWDEELSYEEKEAQILLLETCQQIVNEYGYE